MHHEQGIMPSIFLVCYMQFGDGDIPWHGIIRYLHGHNNSAMEAEEL